VLVTRQIEAARERGFGEAKESNSEDPDQISDLGLLNKRLLGLDKDFQNYQ
jgi:hypothetical protein